MGLDLDDVRKFLKAMLTVTFGLLMSFSARAAEQAAQTTGAMPRMITPARLIPVIGQSSFVTSASQKFSYGNDFAAGLFADFGKDWWVLETGIVTLNTSAQRTGGHLAADINSWGVPVLAKYNFTGSPQQTVFAKTGILPFTVTTMNNELNWLGVLGLGATIPLGTNTSLALDGAYNHILNTGSSLSNDYQGVSLLAGLSINL